MKFLSWNVAGMNDISKCHNVLRKAHKYSVILLQETKLKKAKIHYLRNKWGGGHENVYMASAGRARGVITLFSPQTGACHVETVEDEQGQFLINVVKIQDCMWFIVNMYGDPDTDEASQRTILRFEDKFEELPVSKVHVEHTLELGHLAMEQDLARDVAGHHGGAVSVHHAAVDAFDSSDQETHLLQV